jgi:predicted nuclease with TOPRIM domain
MEQVKVNHAIYSRYMHRGLPCSGLSSSKLVACGPPGTSGSTFSSFEMSPLTSVATCDCPMLRSDMEAAVVEIKYLKHKLDHSYSYIVLSTPYKACVSLKGKLFYANKENTELQQEVAYLTVRLEKTVLSEKMIEEDMSRVEESATKSTYRLGVGFERCEKKDEKSAPIFVSSSSYHKEEEALKPTYINNEVIYVLTEFDSRKRFLVF